MQGETLKTLVEDGLAAIAVADFPALEELRISLLGRNGKVTALLKSFGGMEPGARKGAGAEITAGRTGSDDQDLHGRTLASALPGSIEQRAAARRTRPE